MREKIAFVGKRRSFVGWKVEEVGRRGLFRCDWLFYVEESDFKIAGFLDVRDLFHYDN